MTEQDSPAVPSVLLAFRAENVRSFRDPVELSMLATGLAEREAVAHVPWRDGGRPVGVLPVAGIFGANASGKTALLQAMADMRHHVLQSFRAGSPTGGIVRTPFRLEPEAVAEPSSFEVDVVLNGIRHEYGFRLDDARVIEEWAYRYPHGKASLLFRREGDDVRLGSSGRAKMRSVVDLLRPNALFLSTAGTANNATLLPLFTWFAHNLQLAEAESRPMRQALTAELLENPERRDLVIQMLQVADLGITGATRHPIDPEVRERLQRAVRILEGLEGDAEGTEDDLDIEHLDVRLRHRGSSGEIEMHARDESLGTLVWFGLVGPLVQALADGSTLLVDELDASLHPDLVAHLVRMFQRPASNPHTAQLIFNSHDATLLGDTVSDRLIGRDQLWLTEKNADGATRLYPLSDLKPRKEEALARRYLAGRYGGKPIISTDEFDAVAELITSGGRR